MKILITGMNKNQITKDFYLRQQLKVIPSHYSLIRCFEDMGYEVEQRIVNIGEDLSEYHRVICFLASPRQALQLSFYNGLWAIHATPKENLVLAYDDWQTEDIFKGIQSCVDKESLLKEFTITQNKTCDPTISREVLEPYTDALLDAVKYIGEKKSPMLISAFAGGDLSLLIDYPKELLYSYNPNPYHFNRQAAPSLFGKERVFNFAGLVQSKTKKWLKEQKVEETGWPLKKYGSRKDGQDRVTEDVMVDLYGQQWGILMPGYFHAGSAWWRARPLQVADAGSILIGDYKETILLYKNEEAASVKASDLKNMTDSELEALAKLQRDCLYKAHPLDKEIQQMELRKILNS